MEPGVFFFVVLALAIVCALLMRKMAPELFAGYVVYLVFFVIIAGLRWAFPG